MCCFPVFRSFWLFQNRINWFCSFKQWTIQFWAQEGVGKRSIITKMQDNLSFSYSLFTWVSQTLTLTLSKIWEVFCLRIVLFSGSLFQFPGFYLVRPVRIFSWKILLLRRKVTVRQCSFVGKINLRTSCFFEGNGSLWRPSSNFGKLKFVLSSRSNFSLVTTKYHGCRNDSEVCFAALKRAPT